MGKANLRWSLLLIMMLLGRFTPAQDRYFHPGHPTPPRGEELNRLAARPVVLFGPEQPLYLELTSGFDRLIGRGFDADYQEAVLEMRYDEHLGMGFDLRLRPRGNSRLKACRFPPLMLNFAGSRMHQPGLEDLDEIKLVSPCFDGEAYQRLVLREYLVYRLYQVISPFSFRVRLFRQTWLESSGTVVLEDSYGFFIEEEERLARRMDAEEIKEDDLGPADMDLPSLLRLAFFEYMVGNQDWSVRGRHNVKVFAPAQGGGYIPVPYDFDYTNLVNARYPSGGGPPPDIPPDPRLYKGPCADLDTVMEVLSPFREKEKELLEEVMGFEGLAEEDIDEMVEHIRSFMRLIDEPGRVKALMQNQCS